LEDEGGDGSSVRDYSLFTTKRGDTLFSQSWSPLSPNHRGLIVLLHGLNEHRFEPSYAPFEFILISLALGILTLVYFFQNFDSGRYSDFAKQLNANGFKVYGIDWIGK
jgi:acylglycerol lipase